MAASSIASFFRDFAAAVDAPAILADDHVVDVFVRVCLGDNDKDAMSRDEFSEILNRMFGGLRGLMEKRQCSETARALGLGDAIPISSEEETPTKEQLCSSFDHLAMHMKLFPVACKAIARAVESDKTTGLIGRLTMPEVAQFCVNRNKACAMARALTRSGQSSPSLSSSRKRVSSTGALMIPMTADTWCTKFGVVADSDGTISIERFAEGLVVDADVASSPGLLFALTWVYGIHIETLLRGVVVEEQKRQSKTGESKRSQGHREICTAIARTQLTEADETADQDGENRFIDASKLLPFFRRCLDAGLEDSAPVRLPSAFLRFCRLSGADRARGVSLTMLSRALEALFGHDASLLRRIANAFDVP